MTGKGFISEGDVALLLRRYTTSTILTLLQEVLNAAGSKLDWTNILKNSSAGISNAREYQNLWRHLAYRATLCENFEEDAKPLDDESDLEFEVEPLPGVSPDVAANVAACVKVLAATGPNSNTASKNQDASFVIDIPNSSSGWEVRGHGQSSNVFVQGINTPESQPARKKRKLWTSEEDRELIAAVEKCGEGNWATMLKGAFKHDRTAAQLSQRWALIRKRRDAQAGNIQGSMVDNQAMTTGAMATASDQIPVEAASVLPIVDSQKDNNPGTSTAGVGNSVSLPTPPPRNIQSQDQHCNNGNNPPVAPLAGKGRTPMKRYGVPGLQHLRSANSPTGLADSSPGQATSVVGDPLSVKSTVASFPNTSPVPSRYSAASGMRNTQASSVGHSVPKSPAGPDPMVQAAAVAAGARIAPASAAASLFKAAHSGNIVHIGPGGVSMGKAGTQNQTSPAATGTSQMKAGSSGGSRPSTNTLVHYIRTGTGSSQSLHLASQRASQGRGQFVKSGSPQLVRPNVSTLSSGPSGVVQKGQPSTLMSGSAKAKMSSSPVSPNDMRVAMNEIRATKVLLVDGTSPVSEGITKGADQEVDSVHSGEKIEGKVGLSKSHEGVDQFVVTASSIITDKEDTSALNSNHDKVNSSSSNVRPEDH